MVPIVRHTPAAAKSCRALFASRSSSAAVSLVVLTMVDKYLALMTKPSIVARYTTRIESSKYLSKSYSDSERHTYSESEREQDTVHEKQRTRYSARQ